MARKKMNSCDAIKCKIRHLFSLQADCQWRGHIIDLSLTQFCSKQMPSTDIDEFRRVLSSSKQILVISGAGISAASGIATFRGTAGGRWRKYDAKSVATPSAWAESQSRVWQFFHYRREEVKNAVPNEGHYALARLAIPSLRHKLSPNSQFTHITQNVDGLCGKAIAEVESDIRESSDSKLIEMHGRLFDVVCTAHDCDYHEHKPESPICPALAGTESTVAEGDLEPVVRRADLPHCPKCDQLLRPDVVWFGERPKRIHEVLDIADQADLCLVVGTSALVQPASKLGSRVKGHGGKVAVFNLEMSNHSEEADFVFLGPCETRVVEVLGI